MSDQSSLAMAAKAKAMYGKHLKSDDYTELLRKKTVQEIAGYLKSETAFKSVLQGINEFAIHRGHLEMLIRQTFYLDFLELIRYGQSNKDHFYEYGVLMIEMKQILMTIRLLSETDKTNQIAQLPIFANRMISFDVEKLIKVNTFDELLNVLKNTPYYNLLKPLKPRSVLDIDYANFEVVLKSYYYKRVYEIIEQEFTGKDKQDIRDLFDTQIELENITKIYRLKKYYNSSPVEIKKVLNPTYKRINKKLLDELIETKDAHGFLLAINQNGYNIPTDIKEFQY
ncbi:MAG: V-type ATPase subunit, partial [Erysipelotrichaceae bacterium]|nr:V-type ATPase subunit [Erysipelotrichaceae bacterium]